MIIQAASGNEQAAVTVAEEAEVVVEGIAIDVAPTVISDESRNEEQQGGLRLVEISYQSTDNMIFVAWSNHQLCVSIQMLYPFSVHPLQDITIGLQGTDIKTFKLVRVPLQDVHCVQLRILAKLYAKPVD